MINIMQLDIEVKQELEQRFIFRSLLGKGSFGAVYQCQDKRDNQIYAVKIISKSNVKKSKMKCLREEARLLSSINHTNIVKVYQFVETDTFIYLRMEFIKHGTLQKFIKNRWESGQKFTDEEMAAIMRSIFQSLHYIHSINIIHRDIKPENLLMPCTQDFTQLKMADFGLSTKLDFFYPKTATSKCGTMLFMAPEVLNNLSYSKSVDIWSCSIIMFLLSKGRHPFYKSKMTTEDYKTKIKTVVFESLNDRLANDFLQRISKVDPNQRYTTQQALKHPWLTRQLDDQIPQSLHQSFLGFQKSHYISNIFKLFLTSKYMNCEGKKIEIPENYLTKKDRQINIHHQLSNRKGCKTGWRKQREKIMMEQKLKISKSSTNMAIINTQNQTIEHKNNTHNQAESPAIIKLNKIFDSLLDRKAKKKQNRFYTDANRSIEQNQCKIKMSTESTTISPTKIVNEPSKNTLLPAINKDNSINEKQQKAQRVPYNGSFINRSKNQSILTNQYLTKKSFSPKTPCYKRAEKQSPPKFIQYKDKLEKQIERFVRQYKTETQIESKERTDRNKKRRMLPENKKNQPKNWMGDKFMNQKNQFRMLNDKQSPLLSTSSSGYTNKVRYRKKQGSALRLYD